MEVIARKENSDAPARSAIPTPPSLPAAPVIVAESVGIVVALAFPDRVARRVRCPADRGHGGGRRPASAQSDGVGGV